MEQSGRGARDPVYLSLAQWSSSVHASPLSESESTMLSGKSFRSDSTKTYEAKMQAQEPRRVHFEDEEKEAEGIFLPFAPAGFRFEIELFSNTSIENNIEPINGAFQGCNVDFDFDADGLMWTCHAYFRNQETVFTCHLTLASHDKPVLSFQFTSGCLVHFCALFHFVRSMLANGDTSTTGNPLCSQDFALRARPLPMSFQCEPTNEEVLCLLQQCVSQYVDVQRQSLTVLANLVAQHPQECSRLILPFGRSLVSLMEPGQDATVRRLVISTLIHMPLDTMSALIVQNHGIPALVQTLADESANAELRRLAAVALFKTAQINLTNPGQGYFQPGLFEALTEATKNERLKSQLNVILGSL